MAVALLVVDREQSSGSAVPAAVVVEGDPAEGLAAGFGLVGEGSAAHTCYQPVIADIGDVYDDLA